MTFRGMTPMLNVTNLERSLAFYQAVAGLTQISSAEALNQWRWAYLQAGDMGLMLCESGGPPRPADANRRDAWEVIYYFYPTDVVALHTRLHAEGYAVSELRDTFYGMREFELRDPDGHLLWFGQERADVPPLVDPEVP
ncbi:MAG: VOC family protein [Gloeomargaritaceae cyanobacterium C42_A2020_066]|nr:VOC family protein [Gloeomargaritaceae cyanobacterium C42_A2020_066]